MAELHQGALRDLVGRRSWVSAVSPSGGVACPPRADESRRSDQHTGRRMGKSEGAKNLDGLDGVIIALTPFRGSPRGGPESRRAGAFRETCVSLGACRKTSTPPRASTKRLDRRTGLE